MPKNKFTTDTFVAKPENAIRLDKMAAGIEALKQAKSVTITLQQFIKEQYHFSKTPNKSTAFKCTIKDPGLSPFEIDIYDARVILVEVTGKMRKDFDGNEVPERIY